MKIPGVGPGLSGIAIRRGGRAINHCKAMGNTFKECSFVSGHDMNDFRLLWNYLYIDSWDTVPGAMSLAGFLAPRYGQYNVDNIPKLPSFDVILKAKLQSELKPFISCPLTNEHSSKVLPIALQWLIAPYRIAMPLSPGSTPGIFKSYLWVWCWLA